MPVCRLPTRVLGHPTEVGCDPIDVRIHGKVRAFERKQQRARYGFRSHTLERQEILLDLLGALLSQPLERTSAVVGVQGVENRLDPRCLGVRETTDANGFRDSINVRSTDGLIVLASERVSE